MLAFGPSAVEGRPEAAARSALGRGRLGAVDQLAQLLGWGEPVERLARSTVQLARGLVELGLGDAGEALALREVLAQESVGVFVRAPLPGALRVAEVDGDARVDREAAVLCHLVALVPGERAAQ